MRWEYNDNYRDMFDDNVHKDILIVPHQTNVVPNPGDKPFITSKVPKMVANPDYLPEPEPKQEDTRTLHQKRKYIPKKKTVGTTVTYDFEDVAWTIENDDIIKEKFEYTNSINSGDNLSFSSCESAMFKVTIRNNKTYKYIGTGEETDPEEDPTHWAWAPDVPNLQNYQIYDPESDEFLIGEVQAHAVVKLYVYFNHDSSTLLYLGMFIVEEDKTSDNGYEREITAYDFMYTFREMDIINWYKHLFDGIDYNDNDYQKDYGTSTSTSGTSKGHNWKRKPQAEWILGNALKDLFDNFCAYKPTAKEGQAVIGNWEKYADDGANRQYNQDTKEYDGYGMPIKLDPELFEVGGVKKEYSIPSEAYNGENGNPSDAKFHECYGYMNILELPIRKNNKIVQGGALSCGKFLEDIGILAGRYPVIRLDQIVDGDYIDVEDDPNVGYNMYEKCILTFKPIRRGDRDNKIPADNQFDNSDIVKGFKWDNHKVDEVLRMCISKYSDKNEAFINISNGLTDKQKTYINPKSQDYAPELVKSIYVNQNTFVAYLDVNDKNLKDSGTSEGTSESDTDKPTKADYQRIIDLLDTKKVMNSLLYQGYKNIRYRSYIPYEMTVVSDLCREAGDRIKIHFLDKITGEEVDIYTYILERKTTGIQKMMDTYAAKGDTNSVVFTNYQASTTYNQGNMPYQSLTGIMPSSNEDVDSSTGETSGVIDGFDMNIFCEVVRNMGVRFLDEPTKCEAYFSKGGTVGPSTETITYVPVDTDIGDWDGVYPTEGDKSTHGLAYSAKDPSTGSWSDYPVAKGDPVEFILNEDDNCYYFYSLNGEWIKHRCITKYYDGLLSQCSSVILPDELAPGDTDPNIEINGIPVTAEIGDYMIIWSNHCYNLSGLDNFATPSDPNYAYQAYYISPGVWSNQSAGNPNRRLIYNGSGNVELLVPLFVLSEDITMKTIGTTDIYKCSNANSLIVNGSYRITPNYGDYLLYDDEAPIGYVDENNVIHRDYRLNSHTYIYPGIWFNMSTVERYGESLPYRTIQYTTSGGTSGPSVLLKWSDPPNITTYEPHPCTWEGTVVIRKEGSAPIHRWDGVKVVRSTTRDKYKDDPYEDTEIEINKTYYYGFFPYYTMLDDEDHPIRCYRFTKSIKVETTVNVKTPTIESVELESASQTRGTRAASSKKKNNAIVTYNIPKLDIGEYTECKLLIKKDEIPDSEADADRVVDIDPNETSVTVKKLTGLSKYYFVAYVYTNQDQESESDYKELDTVEDETEWNFDYTGEIEEWTAPYTGIYSLETWGAQGGDATDGANIARGGYGAYAYGEVFLQEGDKLYVNVGGQNGYGGGGNGLVTYDVKNIAKTLNYEHIKSGANYSNLTEWYLTDWWLYFGQINENQPVRYADDKFYFLETDASTADNTQVHTLVPVPRLTNVVNIKFKVRRTEVRSTTHWNQLYLNFVYIGDNNSYNRVYIINVNSPVQEGNLIVTTPNLNEWYEFETGEISISMIDYVEFVRTYAGYDIKDIEITCST